LALVFPGLLQYEHFLLFIGAMFCPIFGIVLTDYFFVRGPRISLEDLYRKDGIYWFSKGINPVAVIGWLVGFAVYLGFSPLLLEKIFGIQWAFPWPLGSSLPSLIVAGLIYGPLMRLFYGGGEEKK